MNQKGNALIIGILVGLLIAVGLFEAYYLGTRESNSNVAFTTQSSPVAMASPSSNYGLQNSPQPSASVIAKASPDTADPNGGAAGACLGPTSDSVVTITIGMDNVPEPRCSKVTTNQTLKIVNQTNHNIQGSLGSQVINVDSGQTQAIDVPFGSYLMQGGYFTQVIGEIWLQ